MAHWSLPEDDAAWAPAAPATCAVVPFPVTSPPFVPREPPTLPTIDIVRTSTLPIPPRCSTCGRYGSVRIEIDKIEKFVMHKMQGTGGLYWRAAGKCDRLYLSLCRGMQCAARVAWEKESSLPKQHDRLDLGAAEICHAPLTNWGSNWYRFYASQIFRLCQFRFWHFHRRPRSFREHPLRYRSGGWAQPHLSPFSHFPIFQK